MEAFALTDVGLYRKENQDAVYVQCSPIGNLENIFILADGMGGHNAGEYASKYALERMKDFISECEDEDPVLLFEKAYKLINYEICQKGMEEEKLYNMGTTLVTATIDKNNILTVANVGDSRLYVYNRDTGIKQITSDHSYVEELVRSGQITRDSEFYKQSKNIITRAIGAEKSIKTDVFSVQLEKDDQIIMCSDGLSNMVPDNIISLFLAISESAKDAAENLIWEAKHAGGYDNISAIIIRICEYEDSSEIDSDEDDD